MRLAHIAAIAACALLGVLTQSAGAQISGAVVRVTTTGIVVVPESGIARPEDRGRRSHTNIVGAPNGASGM